MLLLCFASPYLTGAKATLHFEEASKDFGQLPKGQDVVNHDFLWDGLVQVVNCHATYSAPKIPGFVAEKIVIACIGKPLRKEIRVCTKIVGLVVAEPESILLSHLEGTAPIDKTVVIRSTKGELPPIDKIVCSREAITVDLLESNAERHLLRIRIEPTKLKAGIVREEVQIRMGNPEQSVLRVPILAWQNENAT